MQYDQVMAWYVVFRGRRPGVYDSWTMAHEQVNGFQGACYKKFRTKEEADEAFYGHAKKEKQQPYEEMMQVNPPFRQNSFGVTHVIILVQVVVIVWL